MTIHHIAIWTEDLERLVHFYEKYFQAIRGEKYINHKRKFESYFLRFESGCKLEIMTMPGIESRYKDVLRNVKGLAHFAISIGSKEAVDELTEKLRSDKFDIVGEPRTTGDGYYESVVLDPDGNRIELTT